MKPLRGFFEGASGLKSRTRGKDRDFGCQKVVARFFFPYLPPPSPLPGCSALLSTQILSKGKNEGGDARKGGCRGLDRAQGDALRFDPANERIFQVRIASNGSDNEEAFIMPAKMVFVRKDNAESVATALETHAAATGAAWGELLAPFLAAGEELPDMTLVQRLMARLLVARGEALQEADMAWLEDRDKIIPPRLCRRAATARVLELMQRLRLACQGHFGRELASQIVVAPDGVSDRPWELLAQAEATLARLEDPGFKPPGEALAGCDFDPVRVAAALAPAVEELRAALESVRGRSRKSESTLVAKQRAMAQLDREYSGTVKMFQGLFTFVDQAGLAERLRPPRPRRGAQQQLSAPEVGETARDVAVAAPPRELCAVPTSVDVDACSRTALVAGEPEVAAVSRVATLRLVVDRRTLVLADPPYPNEASGEDPGCYPGLMDVAPSGSGARARDLFGVRTLPEGPVHSSA